MIERMRPTKKKPLGKLEEKLWKVFSEFIRLRDADDNGWCRCCTCGLVRHWKHIDAGHYISRGHKYHKFNEKNVHAQCKGCNAFKQGDAVRYREFLIDKYGLKIVEDMESSKSFPAGLDRWGIELKIQEYREKVKALKNQKDVMA